MKPIFLIFLISFSNLVTAQDVQLQSFVGNTGVQFSNIIQREITKNKKLNYFGFNNISTEYNSIDSIDLDLLNLANYNVHKGIVVVGGMSVNKKDIIPQLGIGYTVDKDRFNLNVFPMLNYSFKQKDWGQEYIL